MLKSWAQIPNERLLVTKEPALRIANFIFPRVI